MRLFRYLFKEFSEKIDATNAKAESLENKIESINIKLGSQPSANELVLSNLWLKTFILGFEDVIKSIEEIEGKKLPFCTSFLSAILVEDLINRNENFKKWADIFGNKLKRNTQKTNINKSKMKIVFVTGVFPGIGHGGGLRAFDLIHELSLSGHEIHLYTSDSLYEDDEAANSLNSLCKTVNIVEAQNFTFTNFEEWLEDNSHTFDIGYYIWPWSVNLFPNNKNRIKKIAFEYIECTVRRLWLDLQTLSLDDNHDKIKTILYDFLNHYYCEVFAAKKADVLISVTERDAFFIKKVFLDTEAEVISTGLSRFEFQNLSHIEPATPYPSACFVGNYFHYPNLDGLAWYLNHVHEKILQSVPDYKFSILGKGSLEAIEQLKIKYKHFDNSLIWAGSFHKVTTAVSPYTICLCPLISGAGLRGKIIQYSALRKATVSTSIGVCGTPFTHNESILIEDDPTRFAQSVIMLLRNEHIRSEMANKAYAITEEQFSWANSIERLENFLQEGTK